MVKELKILYNKLNHLQTEYGTIVIKKIESLII